LVTYLELIDLDSEIKALPYCGADAATNCDDEATAVSKDTF
jgi:hypothetical protein